MYSECDGWSRPRATLEGKPAICLTFRDQRFQGHLLRTPYVLSVGTEYSFDDFSRLVICRKALHQASADPPPRGETIYPSFLELEHVLARLSLGWRSIETRKSAI